VRTEAFAEAGVDVDADDELWPEVATRDFVHSAWRSAARSPAQATALADEQRAVQGLIRTKMFRCENHTKEQRAVLFERAANCGLLVDSNMWLNLSQAKAKQMQRAFYALPVKDRQQLPPLSDALSVRWRPLPAPGTGIWEGARRTAPAPAADKGKAPAADKGKGQAARARAVPAVPAVEVEFEGDESEGGGGEAAPRARSPSPDAPAGEDAMDRWLRTGTYERP